MKKKKIVMVSSTVYGFEELLDRVYLQLSQMEFEVWMSHKGTLPVDSRKTAFQNCLLAVDHCDYFLGIITPQYGSGQDKNKKPILSITHQEMQRAIKRKKLPRWVLVHDHVDFAASLLKKLGYGDKSKRKQLTLEKSPIFEDLRILDLYEEVKREYDANSEKILLSERQGNWAQKFGTVNDAELFVLSQFSRFQDAEKFIRENFNGKGVHV
jgi:hypothetical protein